jgi:aryl-alcohol dehydrogenase
VHLWRLGKFPIEKISKTFSFEQINEAFEASKSGEVIKPVLVFE